MFKIIKSNHPEHDTFFVSDLHFGHDREFIYGKRNFKSLYEHDSALIHRWNETCSQNSVVFNLGDFIFNDALGERFVNICRRLSFGTMYLLAGNHTSGHKKIYTEALKAKYPDAIKEGRVECEIYPLEYLIDNNPNKKIIFLPQYAEAKIGGKDLVLCHYPIISHNNQSGDSYMLCGHSHGSCEFTNIKTGSGYRLDVGIESFGKPINFIDIKQFFNQRKQTSFDHHGL